MICDSYNNEPFKITQSSNQFLQTKQETQVTFEKLTNTTYMVQKQFILLDHASL